MKIIIASPVKNEEWILPSTLKNFSSFADHIILADQKSTDKTREICARFEKVTVIDNPFKGYTNEIRWMLLDEARKIV
jgi:GTP:adenosylcobinamide-phosphate guanylyltransferase